MSIRWSVLAAMLAALTGCAGHDDASVLGTSDLSAELTSPNALVRGVLGADSHANAAVAATEVKQYSAIADDAIAVIEADAPGRVQYIHDEVRSGDPERIIAAKLLLDDSIRKAFANAALASRVHVDPFFATPTEAASTPVLRTASVNLLDTANAMTGNGSCSLPVDGGGKELHLGKVNGRYGDDRTGFGGALRDTADLADVTSLNPLLTLQLVDKGALTPDPESRLGAYAATKGYAAGTTGRAVHNAIGAIYVALANYGQEKIGRVFNAPEAKALYPLKVTTCAGLQVATLEYRYWLDVANEDPFSPGGRLGSAFNPTARDFLQENVFTAP